MDDLELFDAFQPLWRDAKTEEDYPQKRPVLAHYTTIQTLECIIQSNEFWLSNPLLMNDTQELRHGLFLAGHCIQEHAGLRVAFGADGAHQLLRAYGYCHECFSNSDAFDTYVGSFSEHLPDDEDGLLSMWRCYGGNGSGAALILDTAKLTPPPIGESPVVLGRIRYGTDVERKTWVDLKLDLFCHLATQAKVTGESIDLLGQILFNRFLMASLFSKHSGFREEQEWRVAYLSFLDSSKKFADRLTYLNGSRGVEPKFRMAFGNHIEFGGDMSIENLVAKILLGPTAASALSAESVRRMLRTLKHPDLADRVRPSGIPYRSK